MSGVKAASKPMARSMILVGVLLGRSWLYAGNLAGVCGSEGDAGPGSTSLLPDLAPARSASPADGATIGRCGPWRPAAHPCGAPGPDRDQASEPEGQAWQAAEAEGRGGVAPDLNDSNARGRRWLAAGVRARPDADHSRSAASNRSASLRVPRPRASRRRSRSSCCASERRASAIRARTRFKRTSSAWGANERESRAISP